MLRVAGPNIPKTKAMYEFDERKSIDIQIMK